MSNPLIGAPHGGELVDLIVSESRAEELRELSLDMESVVLTDPQLSDLELLANGAYSPLTGFMCKNDCQQVLETMRLSDGLLWPIPICLDVQENAAANLSVGQTVALRDAEGFMPAVMHIKDIWPVDREAYAQGVFGTADPAHPGVDGMFHTMGSHFIGGDVEVLTLPLRFGFRRLRHTPQEIRTLFKKLGWRSVVAFHTEKVLHRPDYEQTIRAMAHARANLLLHPVIGRIRPGDMDTYTRVRCYLAACQKYSPGSMITLSLLPYTMRYAGPREALLHAIIRKNYGCTHFIVAPCHASPEADESCTAFYDPDAAFSLAASYAGELNLSVLQFEDLVYVEEDGAYVPKKEANGRKIRSMTEEEFIKRIQDGKKAPEWFTFPEVAKEMERSYPPKSIQGFTIFCTGLSGAGKSTIAGLVCARLQEMGGRPVTFLDGDIVRKNLSSELGFSKEHRDINVRRIGFVASEITKNRGIAICAPIAPYGATRRQIRRNIETHGGFIEIHVATPLTVCEKRDPKGLYSKARSGLIKDFTGIDDPYEEPERPEVTLDTTDMTPEEAAQEVLLYLERSGYIR
ncbi:bifunctional sulfate adenylyltransferase/adenylylsulfate kinase [Desulfatibacillum aliphaticivorans]|uniref:bifunctional sulfate adenylyltransferase/adenylylsulfate kinase n=1 Tax=Desulfatibacillum aliphaticivorans TaxID=218208 RepID=UPI000426D4F6|nr:bifunctional sulfate adenylyltransferase/adenylylsulfate kinase [Desulfatibacillum aliphaticivorans]